jgi:hypothetical protein
VFSSVVKGAPMVKLVRVAHIRCAFALDECLLLAGRFVERDRTPLHFIYAFSPKTWFGRWESDVPSNSSAKTSTRK